MSVTGTATITADRIINTSDGNGAIDLDDVTGDTPGTGRDLTLDAGTGIVTAQTIGTAAGTDAINATTITGTMINLNGSIFTGEDGAGNDGNVDINGAVILGAATVTIDTSDANGGDAGTVDFSSTIDSDGTSRSLVVNAPSGQ